MLQDETLGIPVYAVALSDASDTDVPIGRALSTAQAAKLIRKHLMETAGDPDPDVSASSVVYSRKGYWIDD